MENSLAAAAKAAGAEVTEVTMEIKMEAVPIKEFIKTDTGYATVETGRYYTPKKPRKRCPVCGTVAAGTHYQVCKRNHRWAWFKYRMNKLFRREK